MDSTTKNQILSRIRRKGMGVVVTPKDFLDLASRDAVDQALTRLVRQGALRRIGRGLYHLPRTNKRLGIVVPPDSDVVASAIGRQTGCRVVPSPGAIANRLGLSAQIPVKPVYLTDGRSRSVRVGNQTFVFKHIAARRLPDADRESSLAILVIFFAMHDSLDDKLIEALRVRLSEKQRRELLREARYADERVAQTARRIAGLVA